jgi:hypothetical protein
MTAENEYAKFLKKKFKRCKIIHCIELQDMVLNKLGGAKYNKSKFKKTIKEILLELSKAHKCVICIGAFELYGKFYELPANGFRPKKSARSCMEKFIMDEIKRFEKKMDHIYINRHALTSALTEFKKVYKSYTKKKYADVTELVRECCAK